MEAITVKRLKRLLEEQIKQGHGDYIVFVTDDEECNGYHALWYAGETPATMTEENRKYCEDYNHDISLVEKGKDSKAYYVG